MSGSQQFLGLDSTLGGHLCRLGVGMPSLAVVLMASPCRGRSGGVPAHRCRRLSARLSRVRVRSRVLWTHRVASARVARLPRARAGSLVWVQTQ